MSWLSVKITHYYWTDKMTFSERGRAITGKFNFGADGSSVAWTELSQPERIMAYHRYLARHAQPPGLAGSPEEIWPELEWRPVSAEQSLSVIWGGYDPANQGEVKAVSGYCGECDGFTSGISHREHHYSLVGNNHEPTEFWVYYCPCCGEILAESTVKIDLPPLANSMSSTSRFPAELPPER